MESVLIFPHQLFENHPCLNKDRSIFLIEEPRFFSAFNFHQQKLIFHRASLKNFEGLLKKRGYKTYYLEDEWENRLREIGSSKLYVAELDDHPLEKKLSLLAKKLKIPLEVVSTPAFITETQEFEDLFKGKKKLRLETFYIYQRKKLDILVDENKKPVGGQWSFDPENRKKLPKSIKIPSALTFRRTSQVKEAMGYVEKKYPQNPGSSHCFNYPTTHAEAKRALKDFLEKRLCLFGDYEDAILQKEKLLFHSCLSPLLNVGLLLPDQVIQETIHYSKKHKVSLNSLEGFIRQVVGWREFVRGAYHLIGEQERSKNFFHHTRKMPQAFYQAATGIDPVDETIKKLQKSSYLHHIERLMILGNFLLLCEIDPDEVYRWFMELFIDAYDWVMVPNVYGMSQYADGGMITTKPYFSSSNYILKMSNYPRKPWCDIWDALFWHFLNRHKKFFENQPRWSVLCKMAPQKSRSLSHIAEKFLQELQ